MITKKFLQDKVEFYFTNYIKKELYPTDAKMLVPSRTSTNKDVYSIELMAMGSSVEDLERFSIESTKTITVFVSIDELIALGNMIPRRNLKEYLTGVEFEINRKTWTIREEEDSVMADKYHKLILEVQK